MTDALEEDNAKLRDNLATFIQRTLRDCIIPGYRIRVQVCGGRNEAIERFRDEVEEQLADERRRRKVINVVRMLLVDSEGAVGARQGCKAHLNRQVGGKLGRNVKENQVFLMVQCVESLFLADPDGLERYYRQRRYSFDKVVLRSEIMQAIGGDSHSLEQIPKTDKEVVHNSVQVPNIPAFIISKAIQGRDYRKSDGFELFGFIDPDKARAESPHCDDFINTMRTLLC